MKLFNKILSALMVLPLLAGLTACSDEHAEYTPAELLNSFEVYFPTEQINTSVYTLTKGSEDGNVFEIVLNRINTKGEVTLNLVSEQSLEKAPVTIPSTVKFEDGASEAKIIASYDPAKMEYDEVDNISISFSGDDYTTPYGFSKYTFSAVIPAPWVSLGYATYTDDCMTTFFNVENIPYKVEIQENSLQPGYYRLVNPYGAAYPYNEPRDFDGSKDYYMYIHAENPNMVYLEPFETGMDWGYGVITIRSLADHYLEGGNALEDIAAAGYCGTLENGEITFPVKGMLISMARQDDGAWYYGNTGGKFSLLLPGFTKTDYSATAAYVGMFTDASNNSSAVVDFTLGADVASAKYAIAPSSNAEGTVANAIVDGSLESAEIKENARVSIPVTEPGKYRAVIVTFNADGDAKESASCVFEYSKGASEWASIGTGAFYDNTVGVLFGLEPTTWEVEIMESTKTPGLYRVVYPFGEGYPYNEPGVYDTSLSYDLEINACDPEGVYFMPHELGIDYGYGMISMTSIAGYYMAKGYDFETVKEAGYMGVLEEGVIAFDANLVLVSMANFSGGNWLQLEEGAGEIAVILPDAYANMVKGHKTFKNAKKSHKKVSHKVSSSASRFLNVSRSMIRKDAKKINVPFRVK